MAEDSRIELRLSRLENDVSSLYDLVADVQATQQEHTRRFDGIDQRFDGIDSTLAEIVRRLPEPS